MNLNCVSLLFTYARKHWTANVWIIKSTALNGDYSMERLLSSSLSRFAPSTMLLLVMLLLFIWAFQVRCLPFVTYFRIQSPHITRHDIRIMLASNISTSILSRSTNFAELLRHNRKETCSINITGTTRVILISSWHWINSPGTGLHGFNCHPAHIEHIRICLFRYGSLWYTWSLRR